MSIVAAVFNHFLDWLTLLIGLTIYLLETMVNTPSAAAINCVP